MDYELTCKRVKFRILRPRSRASSIASISVVISPFENRHDLYDDEEGGILDPKPDCPADPERRQQRTSGQNCALGEGVSIGALYLASQSFGSNRLRSKAHLEEETRAERG